MSENKKGDRLNVKRNLLMKPFIVFALVPYDQRFQGTTSEIPGYKYRLPIPIWYYIHQLMLVFRQQRTPAWPLARHLREPRFLVSRFSDDRTGPSSVAAKASQRKFNIRVPPDPFVQHAPSRPFHHHFYAIFKLSPHKILICRPPSAN